MRRPALGSLLFMVGVAVDATPANAQSAAPLEPLPPPYVTPSPNVAPPPVEPVAPPPPAVPAPVVAPTPTPPFDPDAVLGRPVPHRSLAMLLHASAGADWLRQPPGFSLETVESERVVQGAQLPTVSGMAMWRLAAALDLVFARRWIVPLVGLAGGGATSSPDRIITAVDGSPVEMRPSTMGNVSLLGPGLGVRLTHRRWIFATSARTVLTYAWMGASVVARGTTEQVIVDRWMPAVRVDVEACRRVGPLDHACLYVDTRAYEGSFLNGGSVGLRWEFGG